MCLSQHQSRQCCYLTNTICRLGSMSWYHSVLGSSDVLSSGNFFTQGFNPANVPKNYGDTLTFWDWQKRTVTQQIKLGADGLIPLETRFLHEPSQPQGYVGAALSSNIIRFSKVWVMAALLPAFRIQQPSGLGFLALRQGFHAVFPSSAFSNVIFFASKSCGLFHVEYVH